MEFTVIGDAVNLSWRLQELTKLHGAGIILSSSVALLLADEFPLRAIPNLKTGPIREAYQICEPDADLLVASAAPPNLSDGMPAAKINPAVTATAD